MDYNVTYRNRNGGIQIIVSWKDINGKWHQKPRQGFKTKKEAKQVLEDLLEKCKEEYKIIDKQDKCMKNITFKDFCDIYLDHLKIYKEAWTIINYENSLKKFKDLNNKEIAKITMLDIQQCVDKAIKEGIQTSTLKGYLTKINNIFEAAVKEYYIISKNPYHKPKLISDKKTTEREVLTIKQLDNLINKLDNEKFRMISILAGKCGLRIGEIIGLTWDCVDFQNRILKVRKQWKVLKSGENGFGTLKTKNSNRDIPFSLDVCKELKEYKKKFPLRLDNRVFDYKNTNSVASNLRQAYAYVGYNISAHNLRHTYATMLISNNIDLKTVAELMGHSLDMTIQIYSHVNNDMRKKATNVINNIF